MLIWVVPQPIVAVALVVPPGEIHDGVQADTLDRDAGFGGGAGLLPNVAQPVGAPIAFGPGLGHNYRTSVPCVDLREELTERPVSRVGTMDGWSRFERVDVDPLIPRIVVHTNDVKILRTPAELWPLPPSQ